MAWFSPRTLAGVALNAAQRPGWQFPRQPSPSFSFPPLPSSSSHSAFFSSSSSIMPAKIAVITYSTYGHVDKLADSVEEGIKATGASVSRFQFPETLTPEILAKLHAAPKKAFPVLDDPKTLTEFDGFLFGFPTRFGRAPAQVSALFDNTGGLWLTAGLYSKFAGIFTSTASQHGGHETTILSTLPFFAHQGIIYVPLGFTNPHLSDNTEIVGGSAWGASTIASGDGSRQPTAKDLEIAHGQGKSFATILNQYVAGK